MGWNVLQLFTIHNVKSLHSVACNINTLFTIDTSEFSIILIVFHVDVLNLAIFQFIFFHFAPSSFFALLLLLSDVKVEHFQ